MTEIIGHEGGNHFAIVDRSVVPRPGRAYAKYGNGEWDGDGRVTLYNELSGANMDGSFAWYVIWWTMEDGRKSFTLKV